MNSLVGATRGVRARLAPLGQVKVNGETWKAGTEGGDLLKDERIEVLRTERLTLVMRRVGGSENGSQKTEGQEK